MLLCFQRPKSTIFSRTIEPLKMSRQKIIFKPSFTKDIEEKLSTPKYASILNGEQLSIRYLYINGDQHEFIQLLSYMDKLTHQLIEFAHNGYCGLIKSISSPRYSKLKVLLLRFNHITSIQALTFMDMEQIQMIDISDNYVNQLKALNKTRWQNVDTIKFDTNFISEYNLERIKFSQNLRSISKLNNNFNQRRCWPIQKLIKLQPSFIHSYFHHLCKTSLNSKIYATITERYFPIQ